MKFTHLFRTDKILVIVSTNLDGVDLLDEGPTKEPEVRFVYLKKRLGNKEFFIKRDKNLLSTSILQRFISKIDKATTSDEIKK